MLQFNIFNEDTIAARIADFKTVASFADAIRCDMAFLFLNGVFENSWGEELYSWGFKKPSTGVYANRTRLVYYQVEHGTFTIGHTFIL